MPKENSKSSTTESVSTYSIIWQQCWEEKVCIHIPFDGDKCVTARACVSLVEDGGAYYIEIQLFGSVVRYAIANTCFPALSVGVGTVEVCVSDIVIDHGKLKSIRITVKLCIGAFSISKCWNVFSGVIHFVALAADDEQRKVSGSQIAYSVVED